MVGDGKFRPRVPKSLGRTKRGNVSPTLRDVSPWNTENFNTPSYRGKCSYPPHLVSKMNMLPSSQRLRENVCYLFISRNVLQLFSFSLNIVSDEVVFDLNML